MSEFDDDLEDLDEERTAADMFITLIKNFFILQLASYGMLMLALTSLVFRPMFWFTIATCVAYIGYLT